VCHCQRLPAWWGLEQNSHMHMYVCMHGLHCTSAGACAETVQVLHAILHLPSHGLCMKGTPTQSRVVSGPTCARKAATNRPQQVWRRSTLAGPIATHKTADRDLTPFTACSESM
jgi:hypothetical protein